MKNRRPTLTDEMLRDPWSISPPSYGQDALKNFDRLVASAVARCVNYVADTRGDIADLLSSILGEPVSANTINAYTSEARREHPISAHRFFALIIITQRFDVVDAIIRQIAGKTLGELDAKIFRLGRDYLDSLQADRHLRKTVSDVTGFD